MKLSKIFKISSLSPCVFLVACSAYEYPTGKYLFGQADKCETQKYQLMTIGISKNDGAYIGEILTGEMKDQLAFVGADKSKPAFVADDDSLTMLFRGNNPALDLRLTLKVLPGDVPGQAWLRSFNIEQFNNGEVVRSKNVVDPAMSKGICLIEAERADEFVVDNINKGFESDKSKEAKIGIAKIQMRNISSGLDLYKLDNTNYPSTEQGLEALVTRPSGSPEAKNWREDGYLPRIPLDPWGNQYQYTSEGTEGPFNLYSFGPDGKKGGTGKDADISVRDIK